MTVHIFATLPSGNVPASYLDDNFAVGGSYTPSGTGAVTTTVAAKLGEVVSVKDFGTNTAALLAAVTYINSIGGGDLKLEQGRNYSVDWSSNAANLLVFTNCKNVRIIGNGATITCTNSSGSGKVIFQGVNCSGFEIESLNIVGSLGALSSSNGGEVVCNVMSGTQNVVLRNITASGCYRFFGSNLMSGAFDSAVRDPSPCSGIFIENINILTVYYGFYFGFSGNDAVVRGVVARNTGRVYYNANASNHDVWIDGAHGGPFTDCLISCQSDSGYSADQNTIENVKLNYSTLGRYAGSGNQSAYEALVAFDFTIVSVAAATGFIRNVDVCLNAEAVATNQTANLVVFRKYYNNGSSNVVDTVGGRGHNLKRVVITGQARGCSNLTDSGIVLCATQGSMNWAGDVINGVVVRDFNITGTPPTNALLVNGAGGSVNTQTFSLENVVVDGSISVVNPATANLSYKGVYSSNVTASNNDIGTWIATLGGSTADPTVPVTVNGTYVKIGRMVTVQCGFSNVSTVGATGNILIEGLPFTVEANGIFMGSVTSSNSPIPGLGLVAAVYGGTTQVELVSPQNNGSLVNATHSSTGTGRYFYFTATYFV